MSLLVNQTAANPTTDYFLKAGDAIVADSVTAPAGDNLELAAGTASVVVVNNGAVRVPGAAGLSVTENIHARTMDLSGALLVGGAIRGQSVLASTISAIGNVHAGTMDVSGSLTVGGALNLSGTLAADQFVAEGLTSVGYGLGYGMSTTYGLIDVTRVIPMVSILNANGGLASTSSGVAQFGTMPIGSTFGSIPATVFPDAAKVSVAPYTDFLLYTGGSGSGGSVQFINRSNANFSTFVGDSNLTGNTWNSYKTFFG